MNRVEGFRLLVMVIGVLIPISLFASAASDFSRGSELFRAGNYKGAAQLFESARKQGMDSVALHYNLGSSYYKLGEYDGARHFFLIVAKDKRMSDLAQYNLGLIALKLGDYEQAEDYFNSVVSSSKDDKLRVMAENKLVALERASRPWTGFASANLGYDDNITAAPADAVQGVSGMYYDLFASADFVLSGRRKQGWLGEANFFSIDFFDDDLYDENMYSLGVRREQHVAGWDTRTLLSMSQSNYSGEDFQSIYKLDVKIRKPIAGTTRLQLQYRYEDINSDNGIYDYLHGWRQKLGVDVRNYQPGKILRFYYELELNDRQDLAGPGYEFSYSPTRHTLGGKYSHRLAQDWNLAADLSYRTSDYPATITWDRQDDRWRLRLDADYHLDKTTKLRTRLQYMQNESTVDSYDYDKTIISVGFNKLF